MATLFSYLDQVLIQLDKVTSRILLLIRKLVGGVCGWATPSQMTLLDANFSYPIAPRHPAILNVAAATRAYLLLARPQGPST